MSPFKEKVIQIVRMIPKGKVMSYGQVALYAGLPRAAREVGWILNGTEGKIDLPWWRVINNEGKITIRGAQADKFVQRQLLEQEDIHVSEALQVDMQKYRFLLPVHELKTLQLPQEYIERIIEKYGVLK